MGGLTDFALRNRTLVMVLIAMIMIAGPFSFLTHPSREDPEIVIRTAIVTAKFDGVSPQRVEDLITRKIEEKIREIPEVEHITSTVQNGMTIIKANVYERYSDMVPIWSDLRNKMDDIKGELPEGTEGPFVNDDYGNVAMATIALTGEGFSLSELRETAKDALIKLYTVPGVRKIDLFGVEPERVFVEIDNVRIAQFGISAQDIVNSIQRQNVIFTGGKIEANGSTFSIEPTGNFESIEDIENLSVKLPETKGQVIYLKDIAKITRGYADPPKAPAFFNGAPAIVLSVSMIDLFDSFKFADDLKKSISRIQADLPIGYQLRFITFQPDEIRTAVSGVMNNLYQTIAIVLIVVMVFLGWRTGLLVGAMVPVVMLLSIIIMRVMDIELERMSLATLIIALGLLVDNGIVIAEEISRRLALGEERFEAVKESGRVMALPLLSSSLTTIFAFMPLMLADSTAGEYTRSISLVIAIALLGSWVIAMTAMPVFCYWFIKTPKDAGTTDLYESGFYPLYRKILSFILNFRLLFLAGVGGALALSLLLFQYVPKVFFPASERTQLQISVDAAVGSNSYKVLAAIKPFQAWLLDAKQNPEIVNHVAYVGDGGPRFYLSLDPNDADPFRAFFIVNVKETKDVGVLLDKVRVFALNNMPSVRVSPKPMSMGPGEAGLVEYRIYGWDNLKMKQAADQLTAALREIPHSRNIKDDWENPTVKIIVDIDQAKARRADISSEQVADALNAVLAGSSVTGYREGDQTIPVVLRDQGSARTNIDRLRTLNIGQFDGKPIPLLQIATFRGQPEFSYVQRRDLSKVITVSGSNALMTAEALDRALTPALEKLTANLPLDSKIEKGGELESSAKAQGSLFAYMPLAFALIILVLVAQFDSIARPIIIILTIPLVLIGVSITLTIAPGANFGFMAILGLLALAGIVINNAIVLIDRIELDRASGLAVNEAIVNACITRFKPIQMTTATTALGLLPIILSRDVLFYDLALVIAGGMIAGTVLTLGVVPVLYSLFFGGSLLRR